VPFHTAQLALGGLNDEQIKEAAWVVQSVTGASAYAHAVDYDLDVWHRELEQAVAHVKAQLEKQ
jgi:alkylhydroperoxidase/carboxymuconolactone decarboxylase family protein YurZ